MNENNIPSGFDREQLQKFIQRDEPTLTSQEKQAMWANIDRRTTHQIRSRRTIWYAAASILLLIITVGTLVYAPFTNNPYERLSAIVNVDTLSTVRLYIEDQEIELGEQAEIHCLAATNQIEIRTPGTSFKLSAPLQKETFLQVAVPAGQRTQVVLADHSTIILKAQSKLIFPLKFEGKQRKVSLEGEAYMQIAHDKSRPFSTLTKTMEVCVLGTEFLISAYPGDKEQSVVLVSGRVKIQPNEGESVFMLPNQKYAYNKQTRSHTLQSDVNTASFIGWKEDVLSIENETLSNVLKQIEERHNVVLNYNWNDLNEIRINGKLDMSVSLNEILENLTKIAPIDIKKEERRISIISNQKTK